MIKRVMVENWKTHKKSEFEFSSGTNVLIGPMGAGKTAVMDAVCFALFGTFPALNTRRINLEEVIMSKPSAMEQATVKVEFDYNNENYAVERTVLKKGTNSAKLYKAGKLISGPKMTDVTKTVESLLAMDYNLFMILIILLFIHVELKLIRKPTPLILKSLIFLLRRRVAAREINQ